MPLFGRTITKPFCHYSKHFASKIIHLGLRYTSCLILILINPHLFSNVFSLCKFAKDKAEAQKWATENVDGAFPLLRTKAEQGSNPCVKPAEYQGREGFGGVNFILKSLSIL